MNATPTPPPVSLTVFATVVVVSSAEYLVRAGLGESNEWLPLASMTLGIATIAAMVAALAARAGSRWIALFAGLVLAWVPFASVSVVHALSLAGVLGATAGLLLRARAAATAALATLACVATGMHHYGSQRAPKDPQVVRELPNIVLLVMDTTRRDHLSVYGYPKPTTPNLERFAERAQVYDDAWSVAPWTSPSHASMFTGLLPAEHGVDGALGISFPADVPSLPEVLSDVGYRTAGFPGNANLFASGWERGFDFYLPAEYQRTHSLIRAINNFSRRRRDPAAHAMGDRLLARARRWWEANDGSARFLFVNLIEPHAPYIPSDDLYDEFLDGVERQQALAVQARMRPDGSASPPWESRERKILAGLYDAEIAGMDRRIGEFIDWLEVRDDVDDTLIVITSDHGERLGERGLIGHSLVMDPYLLRVPLLVCYPSRLEPARISKRVQLDGLAAYVLRTAGLASPPAMRGFEERAAAVAQYRPPVSIVDDLAEVDPTLDVDEMRRDRTFVTANGFALEWSASHAPVLTNLESDPNFTLNAAADYPERTQSLLTIAQQLPRYEKQPTREIDPALKRQLKALGYVQ